MRTEFLYDVFLSHNSKDKPRVRRLADRLKQGGLRVWFDEWNIQSGDIIALKVDEGLEHSRVLLLCVSPNALASGWVALERSTAIHRDPANEGRRFIPLLLAECELPDTLRRYKYLDLREDSDAAYAELLESCRPVAVAAEQAAPEVVEKPLSSGARHKKELVKRSGSLAALERTFKAHKGWINALVISPDGSWMATGGDDRIINLWNTDGWKHERALLGHSGDVNSIVLSPDGKVLFSSASDDSVRQWRLDEENHVIIMSGHRHNVLGLAIARDGKTLFSCSANEGPPTWRAWSADTAMQEKAIEDVENSCIYSIAVSPDGRRVVTGGDDAVLKIWDAGSGVFLASLSGHSATIRSVKITPDGRHVISSSRDTTIKVWDMKDLTCLATLEGHANMVRAVAVSPDGVLIASTGFTDDSVRIWDLKSGMCLQIIKADFHMTPISVAFFPDGSRLVVGDAYGRVSIYGLSGSRSTSAEDSPRRYVNAKIVLLGESAAGKTSLAHRLIDDEYVVRDRTHGMNVWRMDLPLSPHEGVEREALLWDLAGQEDYRLIHRLFLDETALAVLLLNPQKDDPFAEAGDWLKALKTAAGNNHAPQREAKRLLVFSQIDVGGMKLGNAKIDRFVDQYGFSEWVATSAKSGENCSDSANDGAPSKLKQLIADSIPWDTLPFTATPRLLAELKRALVAMRDERDIRLLRFSELAQRLEQMLPNERFGDTDVRTAVTLLANHGIVQLLKFGDLVLLQPELLNGYGGAIIRAARAHLDEIGCVLEDSIYDPCFDFTSVERLKHRPDEELLLRALVQTLISHSLCLAEDTLDGRHLVFPSQYRREKDLPHEPAFFVSYTFSGEWQTVWTTLVVRLRYSGQFGHPELWRNAAEFKSSKGHVLGMKISNQQGEGRATIFVYFEHGLPEELKIIGIEYVHRHLERYASDVVRDRRYVCPVSTCAQPVTDLVAVRRRLETGKDSIVCQFCDEWMPLIDFIEKQLKSDPIARRILEMDEATTRELDTQALEQILIGHMMAIAGEANQIFRPVTMFDHGIDGEVEFKDDDGKASGKRIYVQLKSGNSYLRTRKGDGSEIFDVKEERHLDYWISQPVDVYLVIRQTDEPGGVQMIRWMNITRYLKAREDKTSRQIVFEGEKLDMNALWTVRDAYLPRKRAAKKK